MEIVLVVGLLVLGFAAGAVVSWKLGRVRELQADLLAARTSEAQLRATLDVERRTAAEKSGLLEEAERKLSAAFAAVSSENLRSSNEAFLQLAQQTLARFQESARADLDGRQKSIRESLEPVAESLAKVNEKVANLAAGQSDLQRETINLVRALRTPHTRGRWGELQLRRVVEMAGMVERCDFFEQPTMQGEGGRLRPDLIVQLPQGRSLVVDSKVPLSAYLDAQEAKDDQVRKSKLVEHAGQVRTHVRNLAQKAYWRELSGNPEFVVAFLPGESFFSAALEHDPELLEYGVEHGVILATPTTLIALLKCIAYGWRQQELASNAEEISKLGSELYERLGRFTAHFARVGAQLGKAVESYNESVGTLEARVLPSARKMREKGATGAAELAEVEPLDRVPRALHAPELLDGGRLL